MTRHVMLDNVVHKYLKVISQHTDNFGDNCGTVLIYPTEFSDLQREYPIFFRKLSDSSEYQSVAMLGINQDENLFLENDGWHANYIPAVANKGPFLIGFQDQSADGGDEKAPVVHVDMDSPRISETQGVAVFSDLGGNSPYLDHINSLLLRLYDGVSASKMMFEVFEELELIEPVSLDITLVNGERYNLNGNYTISTQKLLALKGEDLVKLNGLGLLSLAFLVANSVGNVQKLINMKNQRIEAHT